LKQGKIHDKVVSRDSWNNAELHKESHTWLSHSEPRYMPFSLHNEIPIRFKTILGSVVTCMPHFDAILRYEPMEETVRKVIDKVQLAESFRCTQRKEF